MRKMMVIAVMVVAMSTATACGTVRETKVTSGTTSTAWTDDGVQKHVVVSDAVTGTVTADYYE